jgi:hypothetical protein
MSLRPTLSVDVPASTATVARAAFPRGNPYLHLRDRLGTILFYSLSTTVAFLWRLPNTTVAFPWHIASSGRLWRGLGGAAPERPGEDHGEIGWAKGLADAGKKAAQLRHAERHQLGKPVTGAPF